MVSCGDVVWNAGAGTVLVDDVFARRIRIVVFHRNAVQIRDHSFGELHVSELPRTCAGFLLLDDRFVLRLAAIHERVISPPQRPSHWPLLFQKTNGDKKFREQFSALKLALRP